MFIKNYITFSFSPANLIYIKENKKKILLNSRKKSFEFFISFSSHFNLICWNCKEQATSSELYLSCWTCSCNFYYIWTKRKPQCTHKSIQHWKFNRLFCLDRLHTWRPCLCLHEHHFFPRFNDKMCFMIIASGKSQLC